MRRTELTLVAQNEKSFGHAKAHSKEFRREVLAACAEWLGMCEAAYDSS